MKRRPLARKRPLQAKTPMKRAKTPLKPRNPARRAHNHARAYGPEDRIQWVKAQPCLVCGTVPSENAHVRSGGMGRKADAKHIVPLCHTHHAALHQVGQKSFEATHRLLLDVWAAIVQDRWDRHATTHDAKDTTNAKR